MVTSDGMKRLTSKEKLFWLTLTMEKNQMAKTKKNQSVSKAWSKTKKK
tara:strand:- start:2245 stop:2388 length:144 start_codon:yes stop_codon:yes gene_type:complete